MINPPEPAKRTRSLTRWLTSFWTWIASRPALRGGHRYQILSGAIVVCGFVLTISAFIYVRNGERLATEKAFDTAAEHYAHMISDGLARSVELVQAVEAFFLATSNVTRESFHAFVQPLLRNSPGVQALEWIPRVPSENRAEYESAARRTWPQFQFTERLKQGQMVPASPRSVYFPVYFVEPHAGNEKALGYDLGSNQARLEALNLARNTGRIVATQRVTLVQETARQYGLLIFDPVYRTKERGLTLVDRREELKGFILGVFRIGDVIEAALHDIHPARVNISLHDETAAPADRFLYRHICQTKGEPPAHGGDPSNKAAGLSYASTLDVGSRKWRLEMTPAQGYFETGTSVLGWTVLFAGFAGTLGLTGYVQLLRRHSLAIEAKEKLLAKSQEVAQLGNWEWDLRKDEFTLSDEARRILGLDPQADGATYEGFLKHIHADDRAAVMHSLDDAMSHATSYSVDHRVALPGGETRVAHEQGEVETDNAGQPVRVFGVVQDITDRKAAEAQIEFLAYYDALTGLLSRTLLRDRIQVMLANARRRRDKLALLFLDLDKFKTINDSLGHAIGDALLVEVAKRLKRWTREQDAIARLGGDEFLVLAPDILEVADVTAAADRIIDSMRSGFLVGDHMLNVTCSIGISIFPEHGTDVDTLIKNADAAMYYSKLSGRNSYSFFSEEMTAKATKRFALQNGMRTALDNDEFFVVYQPQQDINTGKISGCEALLRWKHPELGLVPPQEFIPVAESSGLIIPIGRWLLGTVCRQARLWQDRALPVLPVSVNVSAFEISRTGFLHEVKAALIDADISPECLQLELTESLLISNADTINEMIRDMKDIGVKLLIDDFGTGYSNLSYLRRLPIYKLKIDRSFVQDLTVNPDDTAITKTIIGMAKSLNLKVIAEGVETPIQMSFLRDHGCDEIQGFYFSEPLSAAEFEKKFGADGATLLPPRPRT